MISNPAVAQDQPNARKKRRSQQLSAQSRINFKKRHPAATEKIIIIGKNRLAKEVNLAFAAEGLSTLQVPSVSDALSVKEFPILAFLVAGANGKMSVRHACKILLNKLNDSSSPIPVFAVVKAPFSTAKERALYRIGVGVVFEYPKEKLEIPRIAAELIGTPGSFSKNIDSDRALRRKLNRRLTSESGLFRSDIALCVHNGVVVASGQVDSLWKLRYLKRCLARVPGVRGVFTNSVKVKAKKASDRQIQSRIKRIIKEWSDLDLQTLDVNVASGVVQLQGSAADARELQRVEELLSHSKEIKDISTTVVISEKQSQRDKNVASSANKLVQSLFPDEDINASAFGQVVVLRGTVHRFHDAVEASQAARRIIGISKVVNKLRVASM